MAQKRYFYICNAFDEMVRQQRGINTDAPATSAKVIRTAQAVRLSGGDFWIISLGRGRQKGTMHWLPATIRRIGRVPIAYADFWDIPFLTHFTSLISMCALMLRLTTRKSVLIFFNHQPHYLLTLLIGRLLGRRCILDLEDGFRPDEDFSRAMVNRILLGLYNVMCNGGSMLACSALSNQTRLKPQRICYGVAPSVRGTKDWSSRPLQVLFCGVLLRETGSKMLLEGINFLLQIAPDIIGRLRFVITGYGAFSEQFSEASRLFPKGFLVFRGKISHTEYRKVLINSHIGLCLKQPETSIGITTFPSKVIEMAAHGLLVISTKVSDVPRVLTEDTAVFLNESTPKALAQALITIIADPRKAQRRAQMGQQRIRELLAPEKIGKELINFLNGNVVEP